MVVHSNLSFIFLGYGFNLTLVLLLVGVPLVKAWAVFLLVHTDIGIEALAFLVYHILEIERATCIQGFTLLVGERESTEFTRNSALLLSLFLVLCLALLQTLLVTKDKFDAFLLGIDLKRGIKGFAVLRSHPFYLHSLTFYEVFVLLVREGDAFYFLGDRHSVGTQSDNFIRLWVNGNIGRERLTTLGRYFDGFTQIPRCQKVFFFLIRKLVSHIGKVELRFFS